MLRQVSIDDLVSRLVGMGGSDMHLKVRVPLAVRVHGLLDYLEDYNASRPVDTEGIVRGVLPENLSEEEDFSYAVRSVGRFRVNAFRQRSSVSMVMRFIPFGVPKFEVSRATRCHRDAGARGARHHFGHGATGSGKSTTLASMLDLVNRSVLKHIVTIEEPTEFFPPRRQEHHQPARGWGRTRPRTRGRCGAS